MHAEDRIDASAAERMRLAIEEAEGDEVVFVCQTDVEMMITGFEVVASGSAEAVPAPIEHLQKGQVVIHNHPSGPLRPSTPDVEVAAQLADYGVGSYIVDNGVRELTVVCEPVAAKGLTPLDPDELSALIDSGGALSAMTDFFEPRQSQIDMLRNVVTGFNGSLLVAVEAGTGVGKSFAYLIPAVKWASENDERVVISTATINLQQQLLEKDIPMVQRLLGVHVPAVLVKGRGNYLCRKRLSEALDEDSLFEQTDPDLVAIREWAGKADVGSRSELLFFAADELWSRVNSDADTCTELTCRLRESCFFLRSRREAASARVLIVNHHLLFIDLALRVRGIGFDSRAILPPFRRIVFDEAHSIENSATSLFSDSLSVFSIRKHATRLKRERRGRTLGLLPLLEMRGADGKQVAAAGQCADSVQEAAEAANAAALEVVEGVSFRFTPSLPPETRSALLEPIRELHQRLVALIYALTNLIDGTADEEEGGPVYELRVVIRRIERVSSVCDSFLSYADDPDRVYWIDMQRRRSGESFARFTASPLDISSVMQEAVYDQFDTVAFTSATLTIADSFDYWGGRVGLLTSGRDFIAVHYHSPFPFRERALLAIPSDAPLPGTDEYQAFLSEFLRELLELSEGHALVLFTSYEMLRTTYEELRESLASLGIRCLRQGEADRARLLELFASDSHSVLFATESFWQGVDAPGETLQVVVVCRLPFRVPTDPVLMARMEMIEARGGSAFRDLSLPEAVMKLRQGFGRLIRHTTDRGVVVITDNRILTKHYGSAFLESLPETQQSLRTRDAVLEDIERFLYSQRQAPSTS